MKDETKQKLNEAKEFVSEHESIIATGLWIAGCFVFGRCIGNGIANSMKYVYNRGFDQGMNCCFNLMINENVENSEVLKALVDFNIKHCENH